MRKDAIRGPLKVCKRNSRYFADQSDRPVYLTGAHTWSNIQEFESESPFDYEKYLTWLQDLGHNFTRLWTWEAGTEGEWLHGWEPGKVLVEPTIYNRTGPGLAHDGKPKFDLTKFNERFFSRLRERVRLAQIRGIYVSIMLFQGYELERRDRKVNPWLAHPYNRRNNINRIDGDSQGTGNGWMVETLEIPAITRLQEAYLRKLIDSVNDLNNLVYEVSNESQVSSTEWQYHVINYVHRYERRMGKKHPVGMSYQYAYRRKERGSNDALFNSPAEYVSPNQESYWGYNYCYNPPPADGKKVVLSDTDHLWGIGGDSEWVWKTFLRGHNPVLMDPYDTGFMDPNDSGLMNRGKLDSDWDSARRAMGQTLMFAKRIDLTTMVPHPELTHSAYCLANPGREYLIYYPREMTRRIQIDLTSCKGRVSVEWFNPETGESVRAETVLGGMKKVFVSPFSDSAVLYLRKQ